MELAMGSVDFQQVTNRSSSSLWSAGREATKLQRIGVLQFRSRVMPPFISAIGPLGSYHFFDCAVRKVARGG